MTEWKTAAPKDIPAQLNGCDCGVFMLKVCARLPPLATLRRSHAFPPAIVLCSMPTGWCVHCARLCATSLTPSLRRLQGLQEPLTFRQADMPYFRRRVVANCIAKLVV